ncbi:MAG: UvrD-helicase domain-containing protein [Lachnospiraceae bacterium]|nr:UvrD-helicase domain-containing protein [Lachnospiraceae bacterium]
MDKRVMLAVAGSGKTYTLCNSINENERNLILAYTNENIHNIINELLKRYTYVPEKTEVMTFDKFIYQYIICPYEPTIRQFFNEPNFKRKGITIQEPPKSSYKIGEIWRKNFNYPSQKELGHYHKEGKYYCSLLSELIIKVKKRPINLAQKAISNLNILFDKILIDEFQDFREYDYELITAFIKYCDNILLVGDYYQHSVSANNNSGKPFSKRGKGENNKKDIISYEEYVNLLKKNGALVDTTALIKSRRCPDNICQFISKKLGIKIEADNYHKGNIYFLEGNEIIKILEDDKIIKLVWQDKEKYHFKAENWSYSKGDTYSSVCVILTDTFNNLNKDSFSINGISPIPINKLYVAMSRTKGNLYFIQKKDFDKIKQKYIKR